MTLQGIKQRFGIIGRSEQLDHALNTAMRVASTDLTVLIEGESGVGKEVFSKIIHDLSKRKHNKFLAINCGAIPEGTINSELFGHEKGSFTGAGSDRQGYFETIDGGTIFLDEVGEMPLDTQAYLLRVLESGEFIKVGSSKIIKTDVRIVAATNVKLDDKIRSGKFREDLYYRLNTVPIRVPSLHERRDDIYLLFRKFAIDFAEKYRAQPVALDERAQLIIENYRWPGNVRELKNIVEQVSVLSDKRPVDAEELLRLSPHLLKRNLPAVTNSGNDTSGFQERELLFKFLLDMKSDLGDLKSLVYELINTNDLNVPNMQRLSQDPGALEKYMKSEKIINENNHPISPDYYPINNEDDHNDLIILDNNRRAAYEKSEIVEENLSLETMERDLITKALKKHRGRRKDASEELGISERTLYRKIKQYEIEE